MLNRAAEKTLKTLAKEYSIVLVEGPRQSGKTTLCRHLFSKKPYVLLEDPDTRSFAQNDPRGFLSQFPQGAVLDEVQKAPLLVSYLQGIVDAQPKKKGLFVLTGSQNLMLSSQIKQSLAGRVGILKILPFSLKELASKRNTQDVDDWLLRGFYPRIYDEKLNPSRYYANYYRTYLERDIRELIHLRNALLFEKFIKLCAGRCGQLLNLSALGNEVGITSQTAHDWMALLERTYIVFRLPPHHKNYNKRIVKSPKLYFYDVGLAAYLLGIQNKVQMARDPLRGKLFENLVVIDLMKKRLNAGWDSGLSFFRDKNGNEVDVIYPSSDGLVAIEIKSGQTINESYFKGLTYFSKIAGNEISSKVVLYGGDQEQKRSQGHVLNFHSYLSVL